MNQLQLFETPPAPVRRDPREVKWELAMSIEVEREVMAICAAKPDDWLEWRDFEPVWRKHSIGSYFGHALGRIARRGLINEKPIYYGSEHPSLGNYRGFRCVYRYAGGSVQ